VSEIHNSHGHSYRHNQSDRRYSFNRNNEPNRDDDGPDALSQAIMDTYNAAAAKGTVHEVSNERERDMERDQDRDRKLVRA
jgi:hypothetical protein